MLHKLRQLGRYFYLFTFHSCCVHCPTAISTRALFLALPLRSLSLTWTLLYASDVALRHCSHFGLGIILNTSFPCFLHIAEPFRWPYLHKPPSLLQPSLFGHIVSLFRRVTQTAVSSQVARLAKEVTAIYTCNFHNDTACNQ